MAEFTSVDKERIRYHLGYPNVEVGAGLSAGVMFASEVQFVLEHAMNNVYATTIPRVQRLLDTMDALEVQMTEAPERMQVAKADVVTMNRSEFLDLKEAYGHWQAQLANTLSVPVNPYKPQNSGGLNVRLK